MDKNDIIKNASLLNSKEDLLKLLNRIKADELGDNAYPISLQSINYYCNPNHTRMRYRSFEIAKKSGGMRQIDAPCRGLKNILHYLNYILQAIHNPSAAAYGFIPGKSVADNAEMHVGQNYVLNIDLKDFFPSISQARVWKRLQLPPFNFKQEVANVIAGLCAQRKVQDDGIVKYILPQGAPTSPTITNMICDSMDRKLTRLANRFNLVYTRYADDMTFSSNHYVYSENGQFWKELNRIISEQGFSMNSAKTRLQKKGSRQEVTGLIVCDKVNVVREYVYEIRNLLHIWEKYGFMEANARFIPHYKLKNGRLKRGYPDMINVLSGKLQYLKMVKGASDAVFLKLQDRFNNLLSNFPNYGTDDLIFYQTKTIKEFEESLGVVIQTGISKEGKKYLFFIQNNRHIIVSCSKSINIDEYQKFDISYCKNKSGETFYLVHKPMAKVWVLGVEDLDSLFDDDDIEELSKIKASKDEYKVVRTVSREDTSEVKKYYEFHNPLFITDFLNNFSRKESVLKYSTHYWDKDSEGEYTWTTFEEFRSDIEKEFKKKANNSSTLTKNLIHNSRHLWQEIHNFLLTDQKNNKSYFWGENRMQVGYCYPKDVVKNWMDSNPGMQPARMPLSEFPEEKLPKEKINGKTLSYFSDVIDLFKRVIEFKDNQFYYAVRRIFKRVDYKLNQDELESLKGISFYTDTQFFLQGLSIIEENVAARSEYPEIRISAENIKEKNQKYILLKITQVGSFSNKPLDDDKLMLNGKGQMIELVEKFRSLCDFWVESRFKVNGKISDYRINYLYPSKDGVKEIQDMKPVPYPLEENSAPGFSYIMKIYL